MMFDRAALLKELDFKAVLSGGPGGQHANKTSTKVELSWKLLETSIFPEEKIELLRKNLKTRLTKEQVLLLTSDATRSQHKNKELVTEKFFTLLEDALKVPKKRKKTRPSKMAKLKRLREKRKQAEKKDRRKNPGF